MATQSRLALAGLAGLLVLSAPAAADYLGFTWERDFFALDEVTPLADLPGYGGQAVYNIYATFDDPTDQGVGVAGTPVHPFSVFVQGNPGQGFFNSPFDGGGSYGGSGPPDALILQIYPDLNWDSFFTVGRKIAPFTTRLIIGAGTPGPPDNGKWGGGAIGMNMAWTLPPTYQDGTPVEETLAGDDGRVLFMRLTVDDPGKLIEGTFGVLVFEDGIGSEQPGSFKTLPVPWSAAVLGLAALGLGTRRRRA